MPTKKRIFVLSEASFLNSGFGTYSRELLNRLYDTGKYEIAELACYGKVNDTRDKNVRWRYYANEVDSSDSRYQLYRSKVSHQFGEWRFERCVLDFKPDIVITYRDHWYDSFIRWSPLRPYFHWVWMPTIDSVPIDPTWIDNYIHCDGVLAYTDWGIKELEKAGRGMINLHRSAPAGVDFNVFKPPHNKEKHRKEMGFFDDIFIVGTVMRNQVRKLYPDLFHAFRIFIDNVSDKLARKTYLYVHTSYPDVGWKIPRLIKEFGLGNKVLFTYICRVCSHSFASFFQDARATCPSCNSLACVLPSVSKGLSAEQLAEIYKLFDVYVQYSTNEGQGIPMVEAAACGVPVFATDYSAMEDVAEKLNGFPIQVQAYTRDVDTDAYRARPDGGFFAAKLKELLTSSYLKEKGRDALAGVKKHYTWKNTIKTWEDYLDTVQLEGKQGQWDAPPEFFNIPNSFPKDKNNADFINWLVKEVLHEPQLVDSYFAMNIKQDLDYGVTVRGKKLEPIDRQAIYERIKKLAENKIFCEKVRAGMLTMETQDYIEYAHMKEKLNQ